MRAKYKGPLRKVEFDLLADARGLFPKGVVTKLKEIADKKNLPVSRLIAYAIDNELSCQNPFNFDVSLPETEYVEDLYVPQSHVVYKYLQRFPFGTSLDQLVMCRWDFEIEDPKIVLEAVRVLLKRQVIEIFRPSDNAFKKHNRELLYIRVPNQLPERKERKRKKIEPKQKGPLDEYEPED